MKDQFSDIIQIIKKARNNAIKAVNSELINLYWNVGAYISQKVEISEWGQAVVKELSEFIIKNEPEIKGFSDKNLWRMKQFYETYKDSPKLSPMVREISWSHNMIIFSRCKTSEEQDFILK
jgi:predicted nuclease of restriction endonuclease-like (RecB) superfamily